MSRWRRFLVGLGLVVVSIVFSLGLLSIADHILLTHRPAGFAESWEQELTLSTLDYYPYSGHHIQAHFHETGPDPVDGGNYDIRSGDHGFFVDFPLDHPPPKAPHEFRLILTGGSAAQGFRGRTNEEMFYRLLEKRVNAQLAKRGREETLRVINLAMGGAISYQNFIALNLWGHPLQPDAILSFSGANEWKMYETFGSNLFLYSAAYGGFARTLRHWESQSWQKALAKFFPNVFAASKVALALRMLALPQRVGQFIEDYASRFPREDPAMAAAHFQAHALFSMLRDFPSVPLLLVTQPNQDGGASYDTAQAELVETLMKSELSHRIIYLNSHALWKANDFFPGSLTDEVHFSNAGQERIAEYLTQPVTQLVVGGDH